MISSNRLFIIENLGAVSYYYDCAVTAQLLKYPNSSLELGYFDVSVLNELDTKNLKNFNYFFTEKI